MAEPETKKKTSSTSIMPDWSQLLEELLYLISTHLENCFDVVHARSVCRSWRSTFPFPSSLLRQSYSLPSFPLETNDLCTLTLEKVPSFLFCRVLTPSASTSEFFLGRIRGYESEDHMELPSPLQCSMKVKIPGSDQTLLNMLDCQIISLGHQYRIKGRDFRRVAVLPLESGEFVVLLITYRNSLLVLTSAEMRWMPLENVPNALCSDLVTFRGRFYAIFYMQPRFYASKIVVIDPYSLEVTLLLPPPSEPTLTLYHLVPSGNDELFLVEMIFQTVGGLDISQSKCKVSRLDEAGTWVKVSDLGDRVWFIGKLGIFSCSAKELPHGCGLSENSILFTNVPGNVNFSYKYGVHRGDAEDDLSCLRISTDNRVMMLNKSFPVVAFRVDDTYIISDSNADVDERFGLRRSC